MRFTQIDYLDEFGMWIIDIKRLDNKWMLKIHPGKIIESSSMRFIVQELKKHVVNEAIELCCEAINVKTEYIVKKGRMQNKADEKFAVAIVLVDLFKNNVGLVHIGRQLGWRDHAMVYWAINQRAVKPVEKLVAKIYSRYPFLKDGFKSLR